MAWSPSAVFSTPRVAVATASRESRCCSLACKSTRTSRVGGTQRRHGKLWLLLNLEAWYRRWIRGERAAKAPDPTVPSAVHGSRI